MLASALAAIVAGCVSQGGPGSTVQQASLAEPAVATTKVDAEVQRIFAVAGLDPSDPQKSRSVDRQSMGTVLAIRSGGRKVGMAVAHVGRDQIQLQDPDAVARAVPGADVDSLAKALAGPLPTTGSVPGARFAFDRKHLAFEIEAERTGAPSIASALLASKFVRSDRIGDPIPAEVVASIRSGGRAAEPDRQSGQDLVADLPKPTAPQVASAQAPDFLASLLGGSKSQAANAATAPPPPAVLPPPAPPPQAQPTMAAGIVTPPAPSTYEAGPASVTVADESYAMDRPARRPTQTAQTVLGYAAAAPAVREVPASPTVRRW